MYTPIYKHKITKIDTHFQTQTLISQKFEFKTLTCKVQIQIPA